MVSNEFLSKTTSTEWFVANQRNPDARNLTYCDFPSKWRCNGQIRAWEKRQRENGRIGRIYYVHPSVGERYYFKMLLFIIKGVQSYEALHTYNNITYAIF
jgi:hypothetical protein